MDDNDVPADEVSATPAVAPEPDDQPSHSGYPDELLSGKPTAEDYAIAAYHRELLNTSSKRPAFLGKFKPRYSVVSIPPGILSAPASKVSISSSWSESIDDFGEELKGHDHDHELRPSIISSTLSVDTGDELKEKGDEEETQEEEAEAHPSASTVTAEAEVVKEEPKPFVQEFQLRPPFDQRFRPLAVQHWIEKAITEIIGDQEYSEEESVNWSKAIAKEILDKTKAMEFNRYKLIAQVTLGERRGQGATSAQRCLWDTNADSFATYTYVRETLFCIGTVYAMYFY